MCPQYNLDEDNSEGTIAINLLPLVSKNPAADTQATNTGTQQKWVFHQVYPLLVWCRITVIKITWKQEVRRNAEINSL